MLEREQREVREARDIRLGRIEPEDAALVARPVSEIEWLGHAGGSPTERTSG